MCRELLTIDRISPRADRVTPGNTQPPGTPMCFSGSYEKPATFRGRPQRIPFPETPTASNISTLRSRHSCMQLTTLRRAPIAATIDNLEWGPIRVPPAPSSTTTPSLVQPSPDRHAITPCDPSPHLRPPTKSTPPTPPGARYPLGRDELSCLPDPALAHLTLPDSCGTLARIRQHRRPSPPLFLRSISPPLSIDEPGIPCIFISLGPSPRPTCGCLPTFELRSDALRRWRRDPTHSSLPPPSSSSGGAQGQPEQRHPSSCLLP